MCKKGQLNFNDKIEALNNLYQYYKVINAKKALIQNSQTNDKQSMEKIKITENYKNTALTWVDYLKLKKMIE